MRFCDLGPLTVEADGAEIPIRGLKPITLLAVLLVHANQRVPVDTLVEALWPQGSSPNAGSTLESHVFRVRRVLEPNRPAGQDPRILTNDSGGYRLVVEDEQIDSRRFERLVGQVRDLAVDGEPAVALAMCNEALALWRGRPYEMLAELPSFAPVVARLDGLAAEVHERRIDALLALGQIDPALAAVADRLQVTPFRERLWGQRMLGLYRAARSEEALQAYQEARAVLLDEVGIEPGPELRELHQRVLNQDSRLLLASATEPEESPTGARLQFRVLGPLDVLCDGERLDLGPPKQRAVLAKLLLADGRVVSADQLLDALWGDNPPPAAMSSLQAYVSKLRGLLHGITDGGAHLFRRAPGYALEVDNLDVTAFRHFSGQAAAALAGRQWKTAARAAGTALDRWRGELLADLSEDWVAFEAARLDEPHGRCREIEVAALLGDSRVAEAVDRSRELVESYPLREHARWLRMMSLHRASRSAEALETYQDYARRLDLELGLQPGPELRDLQTAILRHDPAIASWPENPGREPTTGSRPAQAPGLGRSGPGAVVGRDTELSTIEQLLEDVIAGGNRWLLLSGPAGIGKTRLAEEAVRRFRDRGLRALWTTCPDDEGVPSWWPLRALVADLGTDPDAIFLPPSDTDADTVRFRVYETLSTVLTQAAADEPLLIVIDDVQWLDSASVRALTHLIRTLRSARIAVVLTRRDGEDRTALDDLLLAFSRHEGSFHLPVPPLDGAGATALLNQVAGENLPASEAFSLTSRTGGNPLLLTEYARLPRADRAGGGVPLAAKALLDRRLGRLPEPVIVVLRAAAVLGDVFELDLLADVVGRDLVELVDVLDVAEQDAMISPAHSGRGYQFAHSLLRDEVLSQLSAMRRQALHAQIARVLERRGGATETLIRRAQHLTAARSLVDPAVVVEACRAAADDAEARWDWDVAAHQWGAALTAADSDPATTDSDRDAMLLGRIAALVRAGRWQTVLDSVDVALDEATQQGRTSTIGHLAAALLRTSGAWPWPARGADPSGVLTRLSNLSAAVTDDPAAEVRVLAALSVGNCYAPDLSGPEAMSRRALDLAEQLGDPEVLADAIIGRVLTFVGIAAYSEETTELLARLVELPHALGALDEVLAHNILTMARFSVGDVDGVARHLRAGITGSIEQRLPVTRVQLRWVEATLAQWQGHLDQAEELVGQAYDMHRQTELYHSEVSFLSAYLVLLWDRGQVAGAPDAISRSVDPLVWGAVAAAETGAIEDGRDLLRARLAEVGTEYWFVLGNMTLLAHAAPDLGDVESAQRLLDWLEPHRSYLAIVGQTGALGPVALATGRLRAFLGDPDGARRDLAHAEQLAIGSGGPTALLRTRVARALLEAPSVGRTETLHSLAEAAEQFGLLGLAATARENPPVRPS